MDLLTLIIVVGVMDLLTLIIVVGVYSMPYAPRPQTEAEFDEMTRKGREAWKDVPNASAWVEEHRGNLEAENADLRNSLEDCLGVIWEEFPAALPEPERRARIEALCKAAEELGPVKEPRP